MASRRQEKMTRVIKEAVSDIIQNRLSDPRIEGVISVTEVDLSPDFKSADIYLSILSANDKSINKTFQAIEHAGRHIQKELGHRMTSKFCPHLQFFRDVKFRQTLETLKLIEQAKQEYEQHPLNEPHEEEDV